MITHMADIIFITIVLVLIVIKFYYVLGKDSGDSNQNAKNNKRAKIFGIVPNPIKKKTQGSIGLIGQSTSCQAKSSTNIETKDCKNQKTIQINQMKLETLKENIEKTDAKNKELLTEQLLVNYNECFKKHPSLDLVAIKDSAVMFFEDVSIAFQDGNVDNFDGLLAKPLYEKLKTILDAKKIKKDQIETSTNKEISMIYKVEKSSYTSFEFKDNSLKLSLCFEGLKINYTQNEKEEVIAGSKHNPVKFTNSIVISRPFATDANAAKWIVDDII